MLGHLQAWLGLSLCRNHRCLWAATKNGLCEAHFDALVRIMRVRRNSRYLLDPWDHSDQEQPFELMIDWREFEQMQTVNPRLWYWKRLDRRPAMSERVFRHELEARR